MQNETQFTPEHDGPADGPLLGESAPPPAAKLPDEVSSTAAAPEPHTGRWFQGSFTDWVMTTATVLMTVTAFYS